MNEVNKKEKIKHKGGVWFRRKSSSEHKRLLRDSIPEA